MISVISHTDKLNWESLMIQLIQRIFNMLISINTLKTATKTTPVVKDNQCQATPAVVMAVVSEVAITTKIKVEWTMAEDTTTILEAILIIEAADVEEVDIIEVEEVATTTTKVEVDSTTTFPMEIQVKTTKLLNASFSNLLVNVNLVTNAHLPMEMNSLDKLHHNLKWTDSTEVITNTTTTKSWIISNTLLTPTCKTTDNFLKECYQCQTCKWIQTTSSNNLTHWTRWVQAVLNNHRTTPLGNSNNSLETEAVSTRTVIAKIKVQETQTRCRT